MSLLPPVKAEAANGETDATILRTWTSSAMLIIPMISHLTEEKKDTAPLLTLWPPINVPLSKDFLMEPAPMKHQHFHRV